MKNKFLNLKFLGVVLMLAFALSACSKKDADQQNNVTESEAADLMVQAIDPASGGLVSQTDYAVDISLEAAIAECGLQKDTSITRQGSASGVSYNYQLNWSRLLNCNNNVPAALNFTFSGSGVYDAPRTSSDDSVQGEFEVAGFEPSAANVVFNQNYKRSGSQLSKVYKQRSYASEVQVTTTNLVINKATHKIASGSGTVKVTGTTSGGSSFTYSGSIVFLGNGKATITVNKGGSYTVQW